VAIAFTPDGTGSFFFTEKSTGFVRLFKNGSVQAAPVAALPVTSTGEQGLLGIAVHPQYPDSSFLFVYYTSQRSDRANIVVRLFEQNGSAQVTDTLLVVPRAAGDMGATNHDGGNIHFGPDGKLYVTIGEYGAVSSNAQDTSAANRKGKILRLNPNGTVPADNPFAGKPFWSYGHRNSFDFTFDALTGTMYCSENGPSCNDEVNRVPRGGNLGWPVDGNCSYSGSPAYVRPLYVFPGPGLPALTGIAVYRGQAFPRLWGKLLVAGNSTATVWTMTLTASGDTIVAGSTQSFFSYGTGFADVEIGPDGYIYITNGPYSANRVLRLRPVAPAFSTSPPTSAAVGVPYVYTPTFSGTPPRLTLLSGPAGMVVDTVSWNVRWTPAAGQQGAMGVSLAAGNGAGTTTQDWTVTVATTDAGEHSTALPASWSLLPNYPNPFNPSTRIAYSVARAGWVAVHVEDLLGRRVATLAGGHHSAGMHSVEFRGTALPSGMYFCRLEADGVSLTRTLLLMK
jgi:glucose/arabinose dehydrogenase